MTDEEFVKEMTALALKLNARKGIGSYAFVYMDLVIQIHVVSPILTVWCIQSIDGPYVPSEDLSPLARFTISKIGNCEPINKF